jgi:hypothetical protein
MMLNVECPYCGEEFEDENEDFQESEQYEAECPNCEKIFGYNISISIDTYSCELPCGGKDGDGPHEWKPVMGFPKECFKNKFYCVHCDLEKEVKDME